MRTTIPQLIHIMTTMTIREEQHGYLIAVFPVTQDVLVFPQTLLRWISPLLALSSVWSLKHFCSVATLNLFGPVPPLSAGRSTASLQRSSHSNPYMKTYAVIKALLIPRGMHSCVMFEGVWSRGEWVEVWLNVCGCIFEGVCVCVFAVVRTVRAGLEIWNHCDNGK